MEAYRIGLSHSLESSFERFHRKHAVEDSESNFVLGDGKTVLEAQSSVGISSSLRVGRPSTVDALPTVCASSRLHSAAGPFWSR